MPHPSGASDSDGEHRRFGRWMIVGAWVLLLILLTLFFSQWLQHRSNPNRSLNVVTGPTDQVSVVLKANRAGHYLAPGEINGVAVTFLLDTGATRVALPQGLAEEAGLSRGVRAQSMTANGLAESWLTQIDHLRLGPFEMRDVQAAIIPGMPGRDVLLGMSFLKHLKLEQAGERLRITLPDGA